MKLLEKALVVMLLIFISTLLLRNPALSMLSESKILYVVTTASAEKSIVIAPNSIKASADVVTNDQDKIQQLLKKQQWWIIMPLFWFFGLLLALTPCVLPLLIIITSILGGSNETLTKRETFTMSLVYVLSLSITYAIAGVIVASFGFYLQGYMQNAWIISTFSLIFLLLGFSSLGFFSMQLPRSWRKSISNYNKSRGGSYLGIAVMGVLATLIASPCVAAPLAGVLTYIATSGNVTFGATALFSMGVGIGTPLIIVNTLGIELLQKTGKFQKYVKQFFGILLLGLAIWLLERIINGNVIMFLWAALVIFIAVKMGALKKQPEYVTSEIGYDKSSALFINALLKTISIMILLYGGILIAGGILGNANPFSPLMYEKNAGNNSR